MGTSYTFLQEYGLFDDLPTSVKRDIQCLFNKERTSIFDRINLIIEKKIKGNDGQEKKGLDLEKYDLDVLLAIQNYITSHRKKVMEKLHTLSFKKTNLNELNKLGLNLKEINLILDEPYNEITTIFQDLLKKEGDKVITLEKEPSNDFLSTIWERLIKENNINWTTTPQAFNGTIYKEIAKGQGPTTTVCNNEEGLKKVVKEMEKIRRFFNNPVKTDETYKFISKEDLENLTKKVIKKLETIKDGKDLVLTKYPDYELVKNITGNTGRIYNDDILKGNLKEEHEKILLENFIKVPMKDLYKSDNIDEYDKINKITGKNYTEFNNYSISSNDETIFLSLEDIKSLELKNFNIENEEYKPTEKNIKSELIDYDKIDEIISDLKSIDLEEVYEKYRDIPKEIIDKINITINKMKQVNNLLRRPIIIPGKTEWKNKKGDKEFIPNYEEIESIENVFLKLEGYIKNLKEKIKIQDQLID